MGVVALIAAAATAVLALPTISDVVSLIRARRSRRAGHAARPARPPRFILLVPAHDEEILIESCVRSLRALRYPAAGRHIVVLADNCRDRTVELARAAGVTVLERTDATRPGKPAALAWALAQLPLNTHDAVVIVDADTVLDPEFAVALASRAPLQDRIVQPYNDVRNPAESALTRLAALFASTRYRLNYRLRSAAGLNIPISAGMCIGTGVLLRHGWTAFGLAEDAEAYARLTAAGVPIALEPAAHLYAEEARNLSQSSTQRQRWLTGRFQALAAVGPMVLASRHIGWHQKLDVIAELAVPGPVLHGAIVALGCGLLWATHPAGWGWVAALLAATLVQPATYAVIAWGSSRARWRTLAAFAYLPVYAVWRLIVLARSVGLLWSGAWLRTDRVAARGRAS